VQGPRELAGTLREPSAEHACEDAGYGRVRVRGWAGLHPKVQGPTRAAAVVAPRRSWSGRSGPGGSGAAARRREAARATGALWLWWHALEGVAAAADLGLLWRAYARRFE
jgi:hypothetical protein